MPRIQFKGKNLVANHHLAAPFCELSPQKELSVLPRGENVSLHGNLILHGDNLGGVWEKHDIISAVAPKPPRF
ncbi:MAG: hypothetical protein HAW59_00945 [Betaproteobacteria bacterium]|nr:hypothetical protein [Betaproteobacteria bacterium]